MIFEGIDCAGKSSVITRIRELIGNYNFHDLVVDRFICSLYVFDTFFKRMTTQRMCEIKEMQDNFSKLQIATIFLDISPETAFKRCQVKETFFNYSVIDLAQMRDIYFKAFTELSVQNILHIDVNNKDIDTIAKEILEKIK